jgi:hypothetical protein
MNGENTTAFKANGVNTFHVGPDQSKGCLQKPPLQLSGILDKFESFDVTPVIGKEFPTANLKEWLRDPDSDQLLRDLAITGKS